MVGRDPDKHAPATQGTTSTRKRDRFGQFVSTGAASRKRGAATQSRPPADGQSQTQGRGRKGAAAVPPEREPPGEPQGPRAPPEDAVKTPSSDEERPVACCCGKRFRSERELWTHAAHAAHQDEGAGNLERAIEHARIRLAGDFTNPTTAAKLEELVRRVGERLQPAGDRTDPAAEPQRVFTDGSGDYNESGHFTCGLGVHIVGGASLRLPLPGVDQTVQRAELFAILVAIVVTAPERPTVIYSDSKTSVDWYTTARLAHRNQLDCEGRPNGDILKLIVLASARRSVSVRWVKGHQEGDGFEATGNRTADQLANEGRVGNTDPYQSLSAWLHEHGFEVEPRLCVEQPLEPGERSRTVIHYNVMDCEICGLRLTSTPKKRNHVLHAHPDYLQAEHARYTAPARRWNRVADCLDLSGKTPALVARADPTTSQEPEVSLRAHPRIPILFEGPLKDAAVAESVGRVCSADFPALPWSEQAALLQTLTRQVYEATLASNKVVLDDLAERKRRLEQGPPPSLDPPRAKPEGDVVRPKARMSAAELRHQAMAEHARQLGEMITRAREALGSAEAQDRHAAQRTLRRLTARRNKLEKRLAGGEARSKLVKKYFKNPRAALRAIFGETNPECALRMADIEQHFRELFEERTLDEARRPRWLTDDSYKRLAPETVRALTSAVTPREVDATLRSLSSGSAPGLDGLTYEIWERVPKHDRLLTALFNSWLAVGQVPRQQCVCKTLLLYKKGDPALLSSWRPISLQAAVTKIFMKLLQRRLLAALLRDGILSRMQKGFVNADGCLEHVQMLTMALNDSRRGYTSIYGAFYDLKNAFGSVPQALIFDTLEKHGVPDAIVGVIRSYYARDQTVLVNGQAQSAPMCQRVGVKQGCPLSPLLFVLCLDPALRYIESLGQGYKPRDKPGLEEGLEYSGSAFADDIALVSGSTDGLRAMHEALQQYLDYIQVHVGVEKTAAFGTEYRAQRRRDAPPEITVDGQAVRMLGHNDVYDYLGVSIAPNTGLQVKRARGSERLADVCEKIERLASVGLLPWQVQDAIKTYLLPRLVYSMTQLDMAATGLDAVDKAVRKALRTSLDLPPSAPTAFFHSSPAVGGLGMPEACMERKIFLVVTWFRLLTSEDALVRAMAWREVEEMKNDAKVVTVEGAEARTNSKRCRHFLDWETNDRGDISRTVKGASNGRVSTLVKALAALGCQMKKDAGGNLVLYSGSMPITTELSRTLRGIYRERLACSWLHSATGTHVSLAQKEALGNWWIGNPRYLSASDYRFACKFRVNCLPVAANMYKWKAAPSDLCPLCQAHKGTQKHMMGACPMLLPKYRERHDRMVQVLRQALARKHHVFVEKTIPGSSLRPDLTVPEVGPTRGIYLDVAVTGGESLDGPLMKTIREKTRKYDGQRGIRLDNGAEKVSASTFRVIPVVFTPSGLYRPGLFQDLRNIAGLSKRAVCTLLRKLSAMAIHGSRAIHMARE